MKAILLTATVSTILFLSGCKSKNATSSNESRQTISTNNNTSANNSSSDAADNNAGHIACKLDGRDWKDENALAIQTGTSILNIASDENKKEAISLIVSHPVSGTFNLNHGVSGSYTDASGESYGSMDGTGNVIITNYVPPSDNANGKVEGNFSGTFSFSPQKKVVITAGEFSMPVKKL